MNEYESNTYKDYECTLLQFIYSYYDYGIMAMQYEMNKKAIR